MPIITRCQHCVKPIAHAAVFGDLTMISQPHRSSRPRSEQSLVRWATPQLHDIDALDQMVDPALKGLYPAKSLSRFADVIALCVQV